MGGNTDTLYANTIEELREKVKKWTNTAKSSGLIDIRLGWDRDRVEKTDDGYKIDVWAHT
jgi:hypothetical protein